MSNTNDLLQAKLQTIYIKLGGDSGDAPPPDCMDTLGWWLDMIIQQMSGGSEGDYDNLANKPAIDENTLTKNSTAAGLGLETAAAAGDNADLKTAEKNTLVGAINEVAASISAKVDKLSGVTDCDLIYAKRADGMQGYQELWTEPEANSIPSRDDYGVLYAQPGDADKAVVVNEQLKAAMLSTHKWLPAVGAKAELPAPSTRDPNINYLCRVINDTGAPANNGVWELIAGAEEWTYFSDNLDFIDETELAAAVEQEASDRDAAIAAAVETTLADEAASNVLPPVTKTAFSSLLQAVRNNLKWAISNRNLYKGVNNAAGILIDLGETTVNGQEIIFNIIYNETNSGSLVRQAAIHGQVYGGNGNRTGMVQNGNTPVSVFYFQGTVEEVGNTRSYLWIPSSNTAYWPSAMAEAWFGQSSGDMKKMTVSVSTLAEAPAEALVEIANNAEGYSTTEVKTCSKWIDGKWIYKKTIVYAVANATNLSQPIPSGITGQETYVKIEAFLCRKDVANIRPANWPALSSGDITTADCTNTHIDQNGDIYFRRGSLGAWVEHNLVFTAYYTKITN
jgi:hypothetical protein